MATAPIQSETISFDQNIFTVINDLKKKRKRADIDSIHKEIIKTIDFKDTTKDDLQDRINILLINEKLINKINRNLNSYSMNEAITNTGTSQVLSSNSYFANSDNDSTSDSSVTPQTLLKGSETTSTKSIPDLTIGLLTPTKKTVENAETNSSEKNLDAITQYEKVVQRQNDINTKSDIANNKSDKKHSTKKNKEHAERNKANNSPNNTEPRDVKPKTREKRYVLKYWVKS